MWLLLVAACSVETAPTPSVPVGIAAQMAAKPLEITRHGECRMACRHIDRSEVEHVLRHGELKPERTRTDGECPSHAIEGDTPDGQRVRIVYAACETETRVVTAIDLGRDWPCGGC